LTSRFAHNLTTCTNCRAPPLKILILSILLLLILGLAFSSRIPPAESHVVQSTPAQIERGAYLANHVSVCIDCHSERQWQYFGHPHAPGTEGAGGEFFDLPVGPIYSAALGSWTDGEIYRAITSGVSKDGRLLSSQMPFPQILNRSPLLPMRWPMADTSSI